MGIGQWAMGNGKRAEGRRQKAEVKSNSLLATCYLLLATCYLLLAYGRMAIRPYYLLLATIPCPLLIVGLNFDSYFGIG
jgi:hypothetical protein